MAKEANGAKEKVRKSKIQRPPTELVEGVKFYYERLDRARNERSMNRKEFDGLTFEQDFERNREATYSYLRPKKNDDDVRVNSGTTEKKLELIVNEVSSMNFQPEVRAFDQNSLELVDFGTDLTDMVKKTNEIEVDDDVYLEVTLDLVSQRVALLEECCKDEEGEMVIGETTSTYSRRFAQKRRISALQLYAGDMYIPCTRINEQPYIVIYDRMLYSEAKVLYGDKPNFKWVVPGSNIHNDFVPWFKYRFSQLEDDEVEIVTYMSSSDHDDEYQVIISGVPMEEYGCPMQLRNGYPIAASTAKIISDFFYGKPPVASAKFLQSFQDETLRNLIVKMRQAIRPPLGVTNGKVIGRDPFSPGAMTVGLKKENFERLVDHDGVTSSEFQMFNLITQKAEEFIGANSISNMPGSDKMTATQVIELQKQSIKQLGLIILGLMRLKRDATFLRIYTVLSEHTKPEVALDGSKTYRTMEIENGKTSDGEMCKKIVQMIDRNISKEEQKEVYDWEESQSKKLGKPVRYSFLNVNQLAQIKMTFQVVVTPESRDSGQLDKVLFQDKLTQAGTIQQLTQRPMDGDKVIDDYERTWKSKGWFQKGQGTPPTPPGADPAIAQQAQGILQKTNALAPSQAGSQVGAKQALGMPQ